MYFLYILGVFSYGGFVVWLFDCWYIFWFQYPVIEWRTIGYGYLPLLYFPSAWKPTRNELPWVISGQPHHVNITILDQSATKTLETVVSMCVFAISLVSNKTHLRIPSTPFPIIYVSPLQASSLASHFAPAQPNIGFFTHDAVCF